MTNASLLQESPTMAFDVFISYSSRNKLIADAMKQYLQSKGIRCWKAPDDIVAGESWAAAIPRAIKNSQIMVLIWTTDSMNSRQVVNELTIADRGKKMIIPFRTEPIEPDNEFEYYLAKTHWFDAFGSDNDKDFELLSERVLRNLDESVRPTAKKDINANIVNLDHLEIFKSPLQGDELIAKIKELGDASTSDLVRSCGYVSTNEDGSERPNFNDFYEALLKAKGFEAAGVQPEEAEVFNLHLSAKAKIENGDDLAAIEMLDRAISIALKFNLVDTEIYYERAVALSNLSRYQEALADLTLAIEMSEEPEANYYKLRGIVHEELGDLAVACGDWMVAAELGDTDSSEWFDTQCSCGQDSADFNGEVQPAALTQLSNQASLHYEHGELELAAILYKRCLQGREQALGADHADTLYTAYNLANVFSQQERHTEAIPLRRRELPWCREQNGDTDPGTLASINQLAIDLRETDELEEAESLFRELLDGRQQVLESEDFDIGRALGGLAKTLEAAGKLDDSLKVYKQALDHHLERRGTDDWHTNRKRLDLARVLHKMGSNTVAIKLLHELQLSIGSNDELDEDDRQLISDAAEMLRLIEEDQAEQA